MKRLLFIAHSFPPCGGAGVQRSAKFVRYLPEYDWAPTVLTVDPSCYAVKDNSHTDELAGDVEVIRTGHFDPVVRFARAPDATGATGELKGSGGLNGIGSNGNGAGSSLSLRRAVRRMARNVWVAVDRNLLVPDAAVLWYPRAVRAGLKAAKRTRFDLIYATGEPYSSYFVAQTLSRKLGVPFVIDMRDPWTVESYRNSKRSAARSLVELEQERSLLAESAACVFAFRHAGLYDAAYPQWAGKFHYIPNGYDSADFEGVEPKRFGKFTLVHSGTFLPGYRTAETLLRALRRLLTERAGLASRIEVLFVGKKGEEGGLIRELALDSVVRRIGYVSHHESVAYLKGADLLLLVGGGNCTEETGKVYEYMAVGKPVLALVRTDGAAAAVLAGYGAARVVDREDVEGTARALNELISSLEGLSSRVDRGWISRFERRALTGKLAQVFDQLWEGVS